MPHGIVSQKDAIKARMGSGRAAVPSQRWAMRQAAEAMLLEGGASAEDI